MFNRLSYKEEVHLLFLIHMLDFEKQTEFLLSVLFGEKEFFMSWSVLFSKELFSL